MAEHAFFQGCKRLVQEMLRLKKQRGRRKAAAYWRQVKGLEKRLGNLGGKAGTMPMRTGWPGG